MREDVKVKQVDEFLQARGWKLSGLRGSDWLYVRNGRGRDPLFISVPVRDGGVPPVVWHAVQRFVAEVEEQSSDKATARRRKAS